MAKALSCGVLLLNEYDELLMGHVTGAAWWDIPKGGQDEGESALATVVRETQEETGLTLLPDALIDLGVVHYRPDKSLHLFAGRVTRTRVDPSACICTTYFRQFHTQKLLPELDAFAWVPFEDVPARCAKAMSRLLVGRLPLASLVPMLPAKQCLA
jgi:8-oxo-dGTP pyrophosphatase MutT (NUDIX family)